MHSASRMLCFPVGGGLVATLQFQLDKKSKGVVMYKVKALLDAIAEWEKVDDLVKQIGWNRRVKDKNGNDVPIDELWDGRRNYVLMLAKEVRNEIK